MGLSNWPPLWISNGSVLTYNTLSHYKCPLNTINVHKCSYSTIFKFYRHSSFCNQHVGTLWTAISPGDDWSHADSRNSKVSPGNLRSSRIRIITQRVSNSGSITRRTFSSDRYQSFSNLGTTNRQIRISIGYATSYHHYIIFISRCHCHNQSEKPRFRLREFLF